MHTVIKTFHIHLENPFEVGFGRLFEVRDLRNARVVDQDIDPV